jgi:predicted metallopeptidase
MKYEFSEHWTKVAREVGKRLGFGHIDWSRVSVVKSRGTKTRRTIARIHGLGKVVQLGMQQQPFYTIELISEQFDRQSSEEQIKTIIHELMHIPASFGGGFRHHKGYVNSKTVEEAFSRLQGKNQPELYT